MKDKWGNPQIDSNVYYSVDYLNSARFSSLYGQVNSCLRYEKSKTILEIGPGPGLFSAIMKQLNREVITVDFDSNLQVDIIARLPNLPTESNSFDIVCAFEVLEHQPFEFLAIIFQEMARVSNSYVIVSVPNVTNLKPKLKFSVDLVVNRWHYRKKIQKNKQQSLSNPREHYWEIGVDGIDVNSILLESQKAGLRFLKSYLIEPWFHFLEFQKT